MKRKLKITSNMSMVVDMENTTPAHLEALYRDAVKDKMTLFELATTLNCTFSHAVAMFRAGKKVHEGPTYLEGTVAIDVLAGRKRDDRLKDWTN